MVKRPGSVQVRRKATSPGRAHINREKVDINPEKADLNHVKVDINPEMIIAHAIRKMVLNRVKSVRKVRDHQEAGL
jgi:hypothetical protein